MKQWQHHMVKQDEGKAAYLIELHIQGEALEL